MKTKHIHYKIIESLGGVPALARRLGYTTERVSNWAYRGIPARVILKHPKILKKSFFKDAT